MPPRFDSFPSSWSSELTANAPAPAPGKSSLTQRMARPASPSIVSRPPGVPVQRDAVQRAQQEHDAAAAMGFLGGPADSIEDSLVQMKTDAHTGLDDEAIGTHAAAGVSGAGQALPHLDTIQRAFGPHDVSGVRAHVGGAAADASDAIGAHAYATGNDVAFAAQPDLFLAAHEAAHVVQQRQGVALKSSVGEAGDAYEQHADEIADAVVRGESAAELLGAPAGGGAVAVQRKGGDAASAAKVPHSVTTLHGGATSSWIDAVANVRQQVNNAHELFGLSLDIMTTDLLKGITPKNGWTMVAALAKTVLPLVIGAVTTGPISNFMMVDPRDAAKIAEVANAAPGADVVTVFTGVTAASVASAAGANIKSALVAKAGSFVEEKLGGLIDMAGAQSANLPNPDAGIEAARAANILDKNARIAAIDKSGDNDGGWAVLQELASETRAFAGASLDALIARTVNLHATMSVSVSAGLAAEQLPDLAAVKGMGLNDGQLRMMFDIKAPDMFLTPDLPFSIKDALRGRGTADLDLASAGIPEKSANRLLALPLSQITLPKKVFIDHAGQTLTITFDGKQDWSYSGDFSSFASEHEAAGDADAQSKDARSNLGATAVVRALQSGTMARFGFTGIVDIE